MKLKDFTKHLLALESQGSFANCEVLFRHSSGGECGPVWGARVTNHVDSQGPFDLDEGEFYVCLTVGGN